MQITVQERLQEQLKETREFTDNLQDATRLDGRTHVTVACNGNLGNVPRLAPIVVNAVFEVSDEGGCSGVIYSGDFYAKFDVDESVREAEGDERVALIRESVEPYPANVFR